MKKQISVLIFLILFTFAGSVAAAEKLPENFYLNSEHSVSANVKLNVGSSATVDFVFIPEGSQATVYEYDIDNKTDYNIASLSIGTKSVTITGKALGKTTFFLCCEGEKNGVKNTYIRHIQVEVVDTKVALSSNIQSINEVYSEDLVYPISLTVNPSDAVDMLIYYVDDPTIMKIYQGNQDKTYFTCSVLKPGSTFIHFKAGNTEITIPVTINQATTQNLPNAVLPDLITKETVKSAYEKYLKPYNTAFQNDKLINNDIDDNRSETEPLSSANIKKAENIHNYFRVITGTRPVSYLDTLNQKAMLGSDFCAKVNDIDHFQADGIDSKASEVLHNSNLAHCSSVVSATAGLIWEEANRGGFYSVGHRSWMLDNRLSNWGFAKTGSYWDMYFDYNSRDQKQSKVVAFPSRGAFPIEALSDARNPVAWSIDLGEPYSPNLTDKVRVFVKDQNGTEVELSSYKSNPNDPNGCFASGGGYGDGNGLVFYPKKFVETDTNKDLSKLVGKSITVRIEGLQLKATNSLTYVPCKPLEYTVNFFSIKEEGWSPQITSAKFIDKRTGKEIDSVINLKVGENIDIEVKVTPESLQSEVYPVVSFNELHNYIDLNDKKNNYTLSLLALQEGTRKSELSIIGTNINKEVTFNITEDNSSSSGESSDSNDNGTSDSGSPGQSGSGSGATSSIKVYRLYNKVSGEHLYTTDTNEVSVLSSQPDWNHEGTAWISPSNGKNVFRLYSPITGNHLYTGDTNEIDILSSQRGWSIDNQNKPLYYSGGNVPIYRLYNDGLKQHLLTTDKNEYEVLVNHGWQQEGVALNALSIK